MPVKTLQVTGIDGLVAGALDIARALPAGRFLWFRGISSVNYKLIPKIMRDSRAVDEVFERERRLLTRFRQRSLAYWPAGYPQSDWEHLFAMQHHGMPTRLLDWSENLLVAAYFALAATRSNGSDRAAVWCVDPVEWNRATPILSGYGDHIQVLTTTDEELDAYRPETSKRRNKSPVAIFGTHNSNRIVAQRGTFMVWGNDAQPLEHHANESSAQLTKLEIIGDRSELADAMRMLGFGETMVFPELPSLAEELTRIEGWR